MKTAIDTNALLTFDAAFYDSYFSDVDLHPTG